MSSHESSNSETNSCTVSQSSSKRRRTCTLRQSKEDNLLSSSDTDISYDSDGSLWSPHGSASGDITVAEVLSDETSDSGPDDLYGNFVPRTRPPKIYYENCFKMMKRPEFDVQSLEPIPIPLENFDPSFLMQNFYKLPTLDPSSDSLCAEVISWILQRDFPLPALNRHRFTVTSVHNGQVQEAAYHNSRRLRREQKREALKIFPNYKFNELSPDEDRVVIKRMKYFMKRLKFNSISLKTFLVEISAYGVSENKNTCRMIIGGFLGRPLLSYRRVSDIFNHALLRVIMSEKRMDSDLEEKITNFLTENLDEDGIITQEVIDECVKAFGIPKVIPKSQVANVYRENVIKNPNTLANTEDFDISESEEVIRAVMTLSKTDRMTQVDASEVDWELIGEELRMDPDKVRKHWEEDLYPVVATHFSGEDAACQKWKIDLLERVIDLKVSKENDIDFEALRVYFPYQSPASLKKALRKLVQCKAGRRFTFSVQNALFQFKNQPLQEDESAKAIVNILCSIHESQNCNNI